MELSKVGIWLIGIFVTVNGASVSRKCGEALNGSSGSIIYKYNEEYAPNERCIWTIRSVNNSDLVFKLVAEGFKNNIDKIHISTFKRNAKGPLVDSRTLSHKQSSTIRLRGNVAIIIFYSNSNISDTLKYSNRGTGFILKYSGVGGKFKNKRANENIISDLSVDFRTDGDTLQGSFTHPLSQFGLINYSNNELSTFVISPPNNVPLNNGSIPLVNVDIFFQNGFEICGDFCCDSLYLYEFKDFKLTKRYEYCSEKDVGYKEVGELFILVFTSDDSNVLNGFRVKYRWHY